MIFVIIPTFIPKPDKPLIETLTGTLTYRKPSTQPLALNPVNTIKPINPTTYKTYKPKTARNTANPKPYKAYKPKADFKTLQAL